MRPRRHLPLITYDDDEKPTQVGDLALTYTYPSGRLSGTTLNNVSDAYTYDSYGRLASYTATYTPTSTILYTYTLTRDDVGRITQKVETIGGVTDTYEYAYDSAGRLSTVKKNNVVTDSFTYDSNSNRTGGTINGSAFTATYDDQDRILTFNSQTYTHNRNGDLTKIQWNLTDATDFVYDVMGNLKQATIPGGTVLDYTNDGMDRRIVKRSNSTFRWRYIYENQLRVAAVLNGSSAYGREFVYATKVNVPDYMIFNGNKFRIITDHLGSPRLAVRSDTGAISQRMDYTVLGHVTNDTNPGFQPFGFAGGIYDAQIGLVRFGARDYDPRSGRWAAKDPIRFAGGSLNLYDYVLSDPINYIDPKGLRNDCAGYDMATDRLHHWRRRHAELVDRRHRAEGELEFGMIDDDIDEAKRGICDAERQQRDENDHCNQFPTGMDIPLSN